MIYSLSLRATFYTQNGNAGACGTVHQDSDFICAIGECTLERLTPTELTLVKDSALFSQAICGKQVHITNTGNGKSVTVTVADECPTCSGPNSVDLSTAAFDAIENPSAGVAPISWEFV
jgi:expansin (peptidoglycan-binding protein)